MSPATDTDVLVVGGGPTGLALAIWLAKLNVRVRIIEKAAEYTTSTRALVVQARILELYSQIGLGREISARGHTVHGVNAWISGRRMFRLPITDVGSGMTEFPQISIFTQDDHEALLVDKLAELGVTVDMATELVKLTEDDAQQGYVTAVLKNSTTQKEETITTRYVGGCDGARSAVRKELGIEFPGGTYNQLFYVADVQASGPPVNGEINVCLDDYGFLGIFPMDGKGRVRLVGAVDPKDMSTAEQAKYMSPDDINRRAVDKMQLKIEEINWFSPHHIHHRVANQFRKGRAFLLGDAAHVHSPMGGQGMNTGIGDAINLAWKMAAVIEGQAEDALLDTYQEERKAFADRLVSTTDTAFVGATENDWLSVFVRTRIVPWLIPFLFRFAAIRRFQFRTLSQIRLSYAGMKLSEGGKVGSVQAGQRLPWVGAAEGAECNYDSLEEVRWQAHVYGDADAELVSWCKEQDLKLVVFPWVAEQHGKAGLTRDALYLMRPDTYVAMVAKYADPKVLERYMDKYKIAFGV